MDLIPIFQPINLDILTKEYGVTLNGKSEWVQIEFPYDVAADYDRNFKAFNYSEDDVPDYETNRYNITIFDKDIGENISVYIYLDESLEFIYAIDDIIQVHNTEQNRTLVNDSIFADILEDIDDQAVV